MWNQLPAITDSSTDWAQFHSYLNDVEFVGVPVNKCNQNIANELQLFPQLTSQKPIIVVPVMQRKDVIMHPD